MNTQNIVWYNIGVENPVSPCDSLPDLPVIPRGALVCVTGRAPIWRYGIAFHLLHGSSAGAIATYDPRLGVVVVASHSVQYKEGDIFDVSPEIDM